MKVSEMANDVLAKNVEEFANAFHNESDKEILREAAARLRKIDITDGVIHHGRRK